MSTSTRTGMRRAALFAALLVALGCDRRSRMDVIAALEDARTTGRGQLALALHDPSNGVRARAARAAGRIRSPDVVPDLCRLLHDPDRTVLREAALALARIAELRSTFREVIGESLAVCLELQGDGLGSSHDDVVEAIGRTGGMRARALLVETLRRPRLGARAAAVSGLQRLGVAPDDALVSDLLRDPSPVVREQAALSLAGTRDTTAVRRLLAAARDADSNVRSAAYRTLGTVRDARVAGALVARLNGQEWDPPAQASALLALGRHASASVVPLLHIYVSSPSAQVRRAAARALRLCDAAVVWPDLMALAKDEHATVRAEAARGLGGARRPETRERLKDLLHDRAPGVRDAAIRALAQGDDLDSCRGAIDGGDPVQRAAAIEILAETGEIPAAAIETNLDGALPVLVSSAFLALDTLARTRPVELEEAWKAVPAHDLRADLASRYSRAASTEVKLGTLQVFGSLPGTSACDLLPWMHDPELEVRLAAAALGGSLAEGGSRACVWPTPRALYSQERPLSAAAPHPRVELLPQRAEVVTTRGTFVIALLAREAPLTVRAFARLADLHALEGLAFPSIAPDSLVVASRPVDAGAEAPLDLRSETAGIHFDRGIVGTLARGELPPPLGFFVALGRHPELDDRFTAFGVIVHGMNVIDLLDTEDRILSVSTR